jgi:polar amino acid transport system substrate-binding protein
MKKLLLLLALFCVCNFTLATIAVAEDAIVEETKVFTKDMVIALVDTVSVELQADPKATMEKITAGVHPYKDKDDPSTYIFVYNTAVEIVAHPKQQLVGRSYKGKPDVRGKKFRDEIVDVALKDGTGWVDYSYQKPGESGIHPKTTYCKKVVIDEETTYIVCCGMYLNQ